MTGPDGISKGERDDLVRLAKARARVAKASVEQRQAELLADVEDQLAAIYDPMDAAWAHIVKAAEKVVRDGDIVIARICEERGIDPKLRPSMHLSWYGRGESAMRERRAELRKVAQTRIVADGKRAKVEIDRSSLDVQTQLVAGGLSSDEARAFLEGMPTAEALMPPVDVQSLAPGAKRQRGVQEDEYAALLAEAQRVVGEVEGGAA